ncbi:MAG: GAF domain-containing sensor histidine kinase [Chloroflexi bacterium]|nr:GAF domain-containing sensor histidine kinase [Chloroflexota bacterium]
MENLSMLKKMVCLLSCQPRNMSFQLPAALDCLKSSVEAKAVGIYWREAAGDWQPRAQRPARFRFDERTRGAIENFGDAHPTWGQTSFSWLAVPMKVGGTPVGRLWLVAQRGREFTQDDREFITMAGHQLALAQENARLYDEVQHLAARRGELIRRMVASQDERCRRISRELHDELSQSLTAMALDLEAVQISQGNSRCDATERLRDVRGRLLSALEEVNRIILDLRPALLEDMGLVAALRWYATQRLEPLGIHLRARTPTLDGRLQPHVETTLYRIAQEALTNVAKHSHAQNAWLSIAKANRHFALAVRDDGCGFDVKAVVAHPDDRIGIGLFGMKERATLVGGTFEIQSSHGKGTRILVRIPTELEYTP